MVLSDLSGAPGKRSGGIQRMVWMKACDDTNYVKGLPFHTCLVDLSNGQPIRLPKFSQRALMMMESPTPSSAAS
jgi:hypothetical protein